MVAKVTALIGSRWSGKTTFAQFLCQQNLEAKVIVLLDRLKEQEKKQWSTIVNPHNIRELTRDNLTYIYNAATELASSKSYAELSDTILVLDDIDKPDKMLEDLVMNARPCKITLVLVSEFLNHLSPCVRSQLDSIGVFSYPSTRQEQECWNNWIPKDAFTQIKANEEKKAHDVCWIDLRSKQVTSVKRPINWVDKPVINVSGNLDQKKKEGEIKSDLTRLTESNLLPALTEKEKKENVFFRVLFYGSYRKHYTIMIDCPSTH